MILVIGLVQWEIESKPRASGDDPVPPDVDLLEET